MKPNLIAMAIPAFLFASAASAVDISSSIDTKLDLYGRIYAQDYLQGDTGTENSASSARIGLNASSKLVDDLTVYGRIEWETHGFNSIDATNDYRYAFAGLRTRYNGSIDYGKNDGVLKAITSYTDYSDILPGFGGEATKYTILGDRTASVLTYSNKNLFGVIDGLDFSIQYADKDTKKVTGIKGYTSTNGTMSDSTSDALGINLQYAIFNTGLKLGIGYAQSSVNYWDTDSNKNPNYDVFWDGYNKSRIFGIKYDSDTLQLAAIYNQTWIRSNTENTDSYSGYEFVAKYSYDLELGRLTPSIAYVYQEGKISDVNTDLAKYVAIGVQYDFNKYITALFDYKINLLNEKVSNSVLTSDITTDNQAALGLVFHF